MTTATADVLLKPEISTNVRSFIAAPDWLRASFGAASRLWPALTAVAAERLFFRTQRSAPRDGERTVLEGSTPFSVAGMKAWSWGQGPTVLLVHGWNGRATQLGGFVAPLTARGYRVVAFDALGHGESPGRSMSLPELADCIQRVADELGGVDTVIAHSLGGAATTFALANGLRIERAVFVSPPADPRVFLKIVTAALGVSDEVRERVKLRVERRLGIAMEEMVATRLAPALEPPLLVIHDRNDKEVPWQVGQSVADAWPDAELILTEGLGHQRILRDEAVIDHAVHFTVETGLRYAAA